MNLELLSMPKTGFVILSKNMMLGDPLPPFWDQNPNINFEGSP